MVVGQYESRKKIDEHPNKDYLGMLTRGTQPYMLTMSDQNGHSGLARVCFAVVIGSIINRFDMFT